MVIRYAAILGVFVFAMTLTVHTQSPDDRIWADFLTYLRSSPPANGPLEVIQGFQKTLAATQKKG